MNIVLSNNEPVQGEIVTVSGSGFPPATLTLSGETQIVTNGFLRVTITYPNRSEATKTLVGWEGHPEFNAGDVSFTFRAEEVGLAEVVIWNWMMTEQLASQQFEVFECG